MRDFLSEKVKGIKPSGIRRFFDLASTTEGVISLGVGEPDFDTPWHIREAGITALHQGKTFYTSNSGLPALKKAVSDFTLRHTGVEYNPDSEIFITVGGSEAIDLALRSIINEGDEIIYTDPSYVSYLPCIKLADGVPVPICLKNENRFKLTAEELENAITPKTKAVILAFPNNPTGAIMTKADLEKIVPVILKHDLLVITDEIYSALTYGDEKHTSISSLEGMKERTIVINGFSKAFAMTGWRLGYAMGPGEIISQMIKIHQFAIMCAPTVSQYAAVEALNNGDADVENMRQEYDRRRRYLYNELEKMGLPCFEPEGAFYMFPDIRQFKMTSEEFATRLLNEQKLAVVPGDAFGESGEGFIRISYAYSVSELKEAVRRLKLFTESLK
ncbi:MAG: aminotransferase class I/II-fold pyridoxal phosphate-dependent enzyme [Ruminococcaceae bacterium]|nr:aminotransferase class I/II-fold pyridoxal phosphate-dependent enzyme [Oscillospiraceae bacterium]